MKCVTDSCLDLLRWANSDLEAFFAQPQGAGDIGAEEELASLLQLERRLRCIGVLLSEMLSEKSDIGMQYELLAYQSKLLRLERELADAPPCPDNRSVRPFIQRQAGVA